MADEKISDVIVDGVDVSKGDLRGFVEGGIPTIFSTPDAVRAADLSTKNLIYVMSLNLFFRKDTADTTSADNGTTVILDSESIAFKSVALPQIVAVVFQAMESIADDEEIGFFTAVSDLLFPAGLGTSVATLRTAPASEAVFTIKKNLTGVGTITFEAGQTVGVFAAASAFSLASGDTMSIFGPSPQDVSLLSFSATIRALG